MLPRSVWGKSRHYQTLNLRAEIPGEKAIPFLIKACNKFGKILEYKEKESSIVMKCNTGNSPFIFRKSIVKIDIFTSETSILLKFFAVSRSLMTHEGDLAEIIELIFQDMAVKYNKAQNEMKKERKN